jgi:DNA-binding NtrC family response regulator
MSKPKTKRKPATAAAADAKGHLAQEMFSGHIRELHNFIEHIMAYAEEPANWPLTQQEQIAFVRTVIFQAQKLRKSEGYVTTAVLIAAADLAMAS